MTNAEPSLREAKVRSIGRHGFHNIAYRDWGDLNAPKTAFCVHGLTRNSHDFDPLARRLAVDRRVVCPDLVGRGHSEWLPDPNDYNLLQYNIDLTVLAARVGAERYDWIGTSLGGMMGIAFAGLPNSPIRRLVVNDIAPEVPLSALWRVSEYMREDRRFDNLEEVETHLRATLAPFGPMTDADWRRMARTSSTETEAGFRLAFDPGISKNSRRTWLLVHFNLWRYWDRITCPVLILRGTESDFLTPRLLDRMCRRLPHAEVIEFDGIGHAPTLNAAEQIDPVQNWLDR
ncbi:alpha/beta hydrolase [Pararhodobacter sp. SW119]|uniref:alpha/beta fold hydrolase n=1 Tax=Pararhodobacter sp. SW119 TaxID=2780075 RepID=UPI001AE05741|nr:alpha/beta hydrolase [Pararhodobacter sp. SW119]